MDRIVKVVDGEFLVFGEVMHNLAVMIDTTVGPLKYGEKEFIEDYYNKSIQLYKSAGFGEQADVLRIVDFTNSELEQEEIATFMNYIIMVSANSDNINKMLDMTKEEVKEKLKMLKTLGF